jgi:hypothetical protein
MYRFTIILAVLMMFFTLSATVVTAETDELFYESLRASITVTECVDPGDDVKIDVEGDIIDGGSFDVFAYSLYENADWTYNENHFAVVASGDVIAEDGFEFGNTYAETFMLDRLPGSYKYTFIFGWRNGGGDWYDAVVEADVHFAGESNAVALDVKPQSCPNPLNVHSRGVLSAAIVGSTDFDVTTINPSSVKLVGVDPIHTSYEDVATPYRMMSDVPSETDCTDAGPDGIIDLTLKFRTQEIVDALIQQGYALSDGELIVLTASGGSGNPGACDATITGEDVIRIINKE